MEAYLADWLNLLMRWLHFTAGIAWIGSSFYFIWLDNHLRPAPDADPRVYGELWSVHGGGFYHQRKFLLGPERLPETLHWFKWEAYTTWLSGIGMLAIVYWWGAATWLIDRSVLDLPVPAAIAASVAVLAAGWFIYDAICRTLKNEAALGALVYALLVFASWGLAQVFGARAAYVHVGAIIGTIMAANVFFVIIPGQQRMVDAIRAGRSPDPAPGIAGKQRSVHNNYFTLPVLFIMLSGHYAMTWGHRHAWLVLAAIMAAGVLIRHFFNLRHRGRSAPALPIAAIALLAALAVAIAPSSPKAVPAGAGARSGGAPPAFAQVSAVIAQRCVACHAERPSQPGFAQAPAGVMLDSPERIGAAAARIHQSAVASRTMPIGNLTRMTDEERALLGAWHAAGAPLR